MCQGVAGYQLDRLLILLDSLIVPTRSPVNDPQADIDGTGARVKANGAFELGVGLLVSSHRREKESEPSMPCDVTRVEFKGPLKFFFGSREIVVIPHGGLG